MALTVSQDFQREDINMADAEGLIICVSIAGTSSLRIKSEAPIVLSQGFLKIMKGVLRCFIRR